MEINRTRQEDELRRIKFAMEVLGEPMPETLEEAQAKMRWINQKPKDGAIWIRIQDLGIRHQNMIQNLINNLP